MAISIEFTLWTDPKDWYAQGWRTKHVLGLQIGPFQVRLEHY